jgi:hypothetical protein
MASKPTVYSGRISGNEMPAGERVPYVLFSNRIVSIHMGGREGIPNTTSIAGTDYQPHVWVPTQVLYDEFSPGTEVGSEIEDPVKINIVRPVRGKDFKLSEDALSLIDVLAVRHRILWGYSELTDYVLAATAAARPNDCRLSITSAEAPETIIVPAQHLIVGGLRAAMALELDRRGLLG